MDCPACISVLGLGLTWPNVTAAQVNSAFRVLAREVHPDVGGSTERMQELNAAREQALKIVGGANEVLDKESENEADALKQMHAEAEPKLDRASLKQLRITIGRRLLAVRPRWPRSGPRSAGWGLFLDRAGISHKQAERYMREAQSADGAELGSDTAASKQKYKKPRKPISVADLIASFPAYCTSDIEAIARAAAEEYRRRLATNTMERAA